LKLLLEVITLHVLASLSQAVELQISQCNIPDRQRRDFNKRLRFYLDFWSQTIGCNQPVFSYWQRFALCRLLAVICYWSVSKN